MRRLHMTAVDLFPRSRCYSSSPHFQFEILHESARSSARVGRITTPHGSVDTPAFVAVGTNGALKAVSSDQALAAGVQLMFANTYHLMVHPGTDTIASAGGLHQFMARNAPIITDSGGFQVFSLGDRLAEDDRPELKSRSWRNKRNQTKRQMPSGDHSNAGGLYDDGDDDINQTKEQITPKSLLISVTERGTVFRSYRDGSLIELTPESSVQAQKQIGADIILPLDELPTYGIERDRLRQSVEMSHRWMARSLQEHLKDPRQQAMYGIVHGGVDKELRTLSAEYILSQPFDGVCIGGSLGQDREEMYSLLEWLGPALQQGMSSSRDSDSRSIKRPIHLLGIADACSAKKVVSFGIDTMDSCYPTRAARHGQLLLLPPEDDLGQPGTLRIKKTMYANDFGPLDPELPLSAGCECSRSYLHHLFKAKEPLALTLASIHNICIMNEYMNRLRQLILEDRL